MLAIEKGIPIPNDLRQKIYPFAKMEIGDSFLVPIPHGATDEIVARKCNSVRSVISRTRKQAGFDFAMRTLEEGIRVWRIK